MNDFEENSLTLSLNDTVCVFGLKWLKIYFRFFTGFFIFADLFR